MLFSCSHFVDNTLSHTVDIYDFTCIYSTNSIRTFVACLSDRVCVVEVRLSRAIATRSARSAVTRVTIGCRVVTLSL